MKYTLVFILIILGLNLTQIGIAENSLQYTYSLNQDKQDQNYIFTISFATNSIVYNVNITVGGVTYILQRGLTNNTFYRYIPTNIQNKNAELSVATNKGVTLTSFIIQTKQQPANNKFNGVSFNIIVFILVVGLLLKYVMFYTPKEQK